MDGFLTKIHIIFRVHEEAVQKNVRINTTFMQMEENCISLSSF